jgi:hypothetical protein
MFLKHLASAFPALCVLILAIGPSGCGSVSPAVSGTLFDAAHSVALDGEIVDGTITIYNLDDLNDPEGLVDARLKREITAQLWYTVGQFNGRGGVADLSRLEVTIVDKIPRDDGHLTVKYRAKMLVSWPREVPIPSAVELILPAAGSWDGLDKFFQAYGSDEDEDKKCLALAAHDVSPSIFWYYYRPEKDACPLLNSTSDNPDLVVRVTMAFTVSSENTEGKSPEYEKVWEDGRLVVTAIFGKNEFGSTSDYDGGVSAYREMYEDLLERFGQPARTNLAAGELPSAANDVVELQFGSEAGTVDIHLLLVDEIKSVNAEFKERYNSRTMISDFVSYSGHSGLGANIKALAKMGRFTANQYQIYLVNGCDTFAYVDHALRDAHQKANPADGPDKYFDIITNAMPSYFYMNSRSNMAVIDGLLGKKLTYREVLASFDRRQRAAVTGENDNRWPLPFND